MCVCVYFLSICGGRRIDVVALARVRNSSSSSSGGISTRSSNTFMNIFLALLK